MSRTRSLIGYYGGKSAMSHFIADQLDYKNTNTYIEMFGGGARVLLNKPRHNIEIYSDYSSSLCSLMELMADPRQSNELIHRIYNTEYSQEEFDRAKHIVDFVDTDPIQYYGQCMERELQKLFKEAGIIGPNSNIRSVQKITKEEKKLSALLKYLDQKPEHEKKDILNHLKKLLDIYDDLQMQEEKYGANERNLYNEDLGTPYTPMDAAVAAYVVYTQSRDNMGQYWSQEKFKGNDSYHKHMHNLYDCADRLRNVNVFNLDAMSFFSPYYLNASGNNISRWLEDPSIMMYADPSYISPVDESRILKKREKKSTQESEDSSQSKLESKSPKDLGKTVYAKSFSYSQQENFLGCIVNAKCKMMVSNYDLQLYNKYLNPNTGWRKITYETKTTVGSAKDNRRTECLWCNF